MILLNENKEPVIATTPEGMSANISILDPVALLELKEAYANVTLLTFSENRLMAYFFGAISIELFSINSEDDEVCSAVLEDMYAKLERAGVYVREEKFDFKIKINGSNGQPLEAYESEVGVSFRGNFPVRHEVAIDDVTITVVDSGNVIGLQDGQKIKPVEDMDAFSQLGYDAKESILLMVATKAYENFKGENE